MWFEHMKSLYLPLFFVLLAGVGGTLLIIRMGVEAESAALDADGSSPLDADYDYYIQGMQSTRFDSKGQAVSRLQAERVTHYPEGDRAELQAPGFTAFGAVSNTWQVSAATGTLSPNAERGEERLDLAGGVVLTKPLARGDNLEVRTAALTVYTGTEEALTTEPVTLGTRNTYTEGTGMHALLAQEKIELNNVRGTHDPTPLP